MRTAVDTSVLLDVIVDDPEHAERSLAALRQAAGQGALVICECVLAEIRPAFERDALVGDMLRDWGVELVASTFESCLLAGRMFARYLERRRGGRHRVVADFLIGAHASACADRLLTRDGGFYRDYFEALQVLTP